MKNILVTAATAAFLTLSYVYTRQFALLHDPWPMLCVLSIALVASVGGLLHRESQILVGSLD